MKKYADLKDVEILLFSREAYLQSLKALHKEGWTKTAERYRRSYNRLCVLLSLKKNKISIGEIGK